MASFGEIACAQAGPMATYLIKLYFDITNCIKKHSARPLSEDVYVQPYNYPPFFQVMKSWNSTNI